MNSKGKRYLVVGATGHVGSKVGIRSTITVALADSGPGTQGGWPHARPGQPEFVILVCAERQDRRRSFDTLAAGGARLHSRSAEDGGRPQNSSSLVLVSF